MKRWLWIIFLALPMTASAVPNYVSYFAWCENGAGKVNTQGVQSHNYVMLSFPSCSVSVRVHNGGIATLYSSKTGTPLSNPFYAQPGGLFTFYVDTNLNGFEYDITTSGGNPPPGISPSITMYDVFVAGGGGGGGGGGVTSITGDGLLITNLASSGGVTLTVGAAPAHNFWNGTWHRPACADLSDAGPGCNGSTVTGSGLTLNTPILGAGGTGIKIDPVALTDGAGHWTFAGITDTALGVGGPFCVHSTAGVLSATATDCGGGGGGGVTGVTASTPLHSTAGTAPNISIQNSAGADLTAALGTDLKYFTASGSAATTNDLIVGDAQGGIIDSGVLLSSLTTGITTVAPVHTTGGPSPVISLQNGAIPTPQDVTVAYGSDTAYWTGSAFSAAPGEIMEVDIHGGISNSAVQLQTVATVSGVPAVGAIAAFQPGAVTNGLLAAATAPQIVALFTGCSGTEYLGADGACHPSGTGSVTSFSAGNLSPLFTTSVTNPTTTPSLAFNLSSFSADNIYGNFTGGTAAPTTQAIPACAGDGLHALTYPSHVLTCSAVSGGGSGAANYSQSFISATTVTMTGLAHGFGQKNLLVDCYDNAVPANYLLSAYTINSVTFDVIVTFTTPQTGYCVINGSGGGGGGSGITGLTTNGLVTAASSTTVQTPTGYQFLAATGNTIPAPTGTGVALTITGDAHSSDVLDLKQTGGTNAFKVDATGNGTLAGNLNAVGGTFTGSISAVNGTFSGNTNVAGTGTFGSALPAAGLSLITSAGANTFTTPSSVSGLTWTLPSTTETLIGTIYSQNLAGQTSAISTTNMVTVSGANTLYTFTGAVSCETTSAAATATLTLSWTDVSNTVQTQTSVATCTTLGASSIGQITYTFTAKNATAVSWSVPIANTPTYTAQVRLVNP